MLLFIYYSFTLMVDVCIINPILLSILCTYASSVSLNTCKVANKLLIFASDSAVDFGSDTWFII